MSPLTVPRRRVRPWAHALGTAVVILVIAWASVEGSRLTDGVALWWPAAGVAVAAVITAVPRARAVIVLIVLFASLAGNVLAGRPLTLSALFGICNAAEAATAAWWLLRGRVGRPSLETLNDLWRLLVAAALGAFVIAVGATTTVVLLTDGAPWPLFLHLLASHASATLLVVPLVLRQPTDRMTSPRVEAWAQMSLVALSTILIFSVEPRLSQGFLLLVPLLWAAMRFPLRVTTLEVSLSLMAALTLTAFGLGPLSSALGLTPANTPPGTLSLTDFMLTQLFVVSTLVVILSPALTAHQRRLILAQVGRSERILRGGFEDALLGEVILTSVSGQLEVVEMNAVAADLLDVDERAEIPWDELLGRSAPVALAILTDIADGHSPGWRDEIELHAGRERPRWADIAVSPLTDEPGLLVIQLAETTSRKTMERQLEHLAIHDTLTGLPNRSLLQDRLKRAVADADRTGQPAAVLVLDLDDFKRVNDAAGHAVGDEILREAATRLSAIVREGDTVARLGGDEFAIVLPGAGGPVVTAITSRLRTAFDKPFTVSSGTYRVSASMGVTASEPGSSVEQLLRDADTAMYMSKSQSRGRSTWFDESFHEQVVRDATVAADFEGAIERREIALYAQPIIDLLSGQTVAAEVLVRWQHPTRGLLYPAQWLDIVCSGPNGANLESWIVAESCRMLADWSRDGTYPRMHVNISAPLLRRGDLAEQVLAALERSGAPAGGLVLELTEADLESVRGSLTAELEDLRGAGVRIAVDDFGTGYSSLSRLVHLPLDELKIDKSFIAAMLTDPRSCAIVNAIVGLADALGLSIVAEGVETEDQAQELRRLGCTRGQGFLWSRPKPIGRLMSEIAGGAQDVPATQ